MAFRTNGVVRIASDGGANLGLTTATEFDGKVSKKAITEQTDGDEDNVSDADELLLYDTTSTDLIRVTVREFVEGSGISTAGDLPEVLVAGVRNTTVSTIAAGTPVHVSGYNNGNGRYEIGVADADVSSTMPADGVLQTELASNTNGLMVTYGQVENLNTSTFSVGDELYVASGGGLTNTRPTGSSTQVEKLGVVLRSDSTQGVILVKGAGRSNDVPNEITITGDITARNLNISGISTLGVATASQFTSSGIGSIIAQTFLGDDVNNDAGATVHALGILYPEAGIVIGEVGGLDPSNANIRSKFGDTAIELQLNEGMDTFDITYKQGFGVADTLISIDAAAVVPIISVGCSIIPDTNITYDLGSPTNRFRDIYLDGSTIYLGSTEISADTVVTTTNVGTATTGDQLAWNGTDWAVSSGVVAGVGGGSICLKYKCSSNTTMSDPGNGKFRLNNSTQENSTQLVVSVKTNGGYNINSLLSNVVVGAKIFLQRKDKPDQYYAFIVNATPTLTGSTSSGYYTFSDITGTVNGSTSLGDNKDCILCIKAPDQVSGETITPAAVISDSVTLGVGGPSWTNGTGSPEGVVTAPVGSLYSRTDGGADTTLYVKESGTGNTGWIAK
jgi:hypothetical protein